MLCIDGMAGDVCTGGSTGLANISIAPKSLLCFGHIFLVLTVFLNLPSLVRCEK